MPLATNSENPTFLLTVMDMPHLAELYSIPRVHTLSPLATDEDTGPRDVKSVPQITQLGSVRVQSLSDKAGYQFSTKSY
jgi:hypothetical protein